MAFKDKPSTDFRPIESLDRDQADEELQALRDGTRYHDHLYYIENSPKITDATYDKLFRRLEDLEMAFPELKTGDSPSVRVGSEPVSNLKKILHQAPLLSLQATLEADEIKAFVHHLSTSKRGTRLVLEPKFDGLSVEIVYRHGRFDYGTTRGNGDVGEDISHNLKTIRMLPLELQKQKQAPALLALRGEVYMSRQGFTRLNRQRLSQGLEPFANPRNAAAGLMRQFDSRQVAGKPLCIVCYEILKSDGGLPSTHREVLKQLADWGLVTSPLNKTANSFESVERYHSKLAERRETLDYEIDGIVIKVDDHRLRRHLGSRERTPRWAMAWKFEPREEVTRIEDIVVHVGRTGILTPVALLQPVDVGGVTVSRATLHNEGEVHRKDIRIGDRVRLFRAGDVIPEIEARVKEPGRKRRPPFRMPQCCPACESRVVRDGAYYHCTAGLACPAQLQAHIQHYAARDAMDIDGLGEKTAAQLVARQLVHDLSDLYRLGTEDIESLEGFAERSASQLHNAIHKAMKPRLDRFLLALGIPHVGQHVARLLADEFGTLEEVAGAGRARIESVAGIGTESAAAIASFFADPHNRDVLRRMQASGLEVAAMPKRGRQPLAGKTFVFTGGLKSLTRDEAQTLVEDLGGHASSSVSRETDFVVVGTNPGRKLDQARALDVERIEEQTFLQMVSS